MKYELKEVGKVELPGRKQAIAEFSPDGRSVAAAVDETWRIYDARTLKPVTQELRHGQPIARFEFDREGARVMTVSEDYARVWDGRTGRRLSPRLRHGKSTKIAIAALSPDGKRLLTVADEPPAPPGIRMTPVNAPAPEVTKEQGEVRVWDVQTGELAFALPHPTFVQCALFSPDGSRILTASTFLVGEAYLWDAADGTRVGTPIKEVVVGTPMAAFSADGKRFALNCWYKIQVHAADTGKHLRTIAECAYHALPTSVALSGDGKVVYMTDQATEAQSWDVDTGKQISEPKEGLNTFADGVRFSTDGKWMFMYGYDFGGAGVWDCRTGESLWITTEQVGPITSAVFLPDGSVSLLSAKHGGVEVCRLERAK